jgi:hypothetical protein
MDVSTALELFDWNWYRFSRSTEKAGPQLIAGLLDAFRSVVASPEPGAKTEAERLQSRRAGRWRTAAVFLLAATDGSGDQRSEAWSDAVGALKVFESQYAWGSKQKAARLMDVRSNPRLVQAAQAAAVGSSAVPLELLAVLAMDGSEASADALLPHVERALRNEAELEHLAHLGRYAAKTKAMTSLMELIDRKLGAARDASPAMALATALGLASSSSFRVEAQVPGSGGASLTIDVDSRKGSPGFRGWVHHGSVVRLVDELHQPVCALHELPKWLERWSAKHSVKWAFDQATTRHLRGKRAAIFLDWLAGT